MAICNGDVIMLSSDEDDAKSQLDGSPPKKRAKLITIDTSNASQLSLKRYLKPQSFFTLSSDDEEENVSSTSKIHVNSRNANLNGKKTGEGVKVHTDVSSTDDVINIVDDEIIQCEVASDVEIIDDEPVKEKSSKSDAVAVQKKSSKSDAANDNIKLADNPIVNGRSIEVNIDEIDDEDVETKEVTDSCSQELYIFIDDCLQLTSNPEYKKLLHQKLPLLKKYYKKAKESSFNENEFRKVVKSCSSRITNDTNILLSYTDVYKWLKSAYEYATRDNSLAPKIDRRKENAIKKLEKALKKIRGKIRCLENTELEWDNSEEDDTVYVQLDKYSERAVQLYNKLCKLRDENPNYERLTYMRLDFSYSAYTEINKAINKKYKNNSQFPTYFELDKLIKRCVQKHNLNISQDILKYEITQCFIKLGELLQQRRKVESYQFIQDLLENDKDPAFENPEIAETIKANHSTYNKKLNEVLEKYSRLQDLSSADLQLSSDSDDSHYESNEEENQEESRTSNN